MIDLGIILRDTFWSGIAALGFAMLFNVPRRTLVGCVITGALGHALRTLLMMSIGASIEGGTLVGAICIGFLSYRFGRRWHTPAIIFAVCGVIPMIPGRFAYGTMIGLIQLAEQGSTAPPAVLLDTTVNAVKTAMILGALAVGIAAPSLLFQRNKLRL
ncbi:MAG: threonine/serine exporter family protein [Anaerolineae bacterium]|nr:threonine/serine exporter family protein [Anaerolineae bacterium]